MAKLEVTKTVLFWGAVWLLSGAAAALLLVRLDTRRDARRLVAIEVLLVRVAPPPGKSEGKSEWRHA